MLQNENLKTNNVNSLQNTEKLKEIQIQLEMFHKINPSNIIETLNSGYDQFITENNEINKSFHPNCKIKKELNVPYQHLLITYNKKHIENLVQLIKANRESDEKLLFILCGFLQGIERISTSRYIPKDTNKQTTTTLVLANQQLTFAHVAYHLGVLTLFLNKIKPKCTNGLQKNNVWSVNELQNKTSLAIYLMFKIIIDNVMNSRLYIDTTTIELQQNFYNITPAEMTKELKIYDIKINYSEEFLTTFFGEIFYNGQSPYSRQTQTSVSIDTVLPFGMN